MGDPWDGQGAAQPADSPEAEIPLEDGANNGVNPSPFYNMKPNLPRTNDILGSRDIINDFGLTATYASYCGSKRIRDDLSSYLPHIYGINITPAQDLSSLRMLVENPPITGKEICPLSSSSLNGFRLIPGPVDERYRSLFGRPHENVNNDADERGPPGSYLYMNSLEPLDGDRVEIERRKHKEKKEKKKNKEKKKKDKKDDEKKHRKSSTGVSPM